MAQDELPPVPGTLHHLLRFRASVVRSKHLEDLPIYLQSVYRTPIQADKHVFGFRHFQRCSKSEMLRFNVPTVRFAA